MVAPSKALCTHNRVGTIHQQKPLARRSYSNDISMNTAIRIHWTLNLLLWPDELKQPSLLVNYKLWLNIWTIILWTTLSPRPLVHNVAATSYGSEIVRHQALRRFKRINLRVYHGESTSLSFPLVCRYWRLRYVSVLVREDPPGSPPQRGVIGFLVHYG